MEVVLGYGQVRNGGRSHASTVELPLETNAKLASSAQRMQNRPLDDIRVSSALKLGGDARVKATLKRWVLVCLLLALPWLGLVTAVTSAVGVRHSHSTAAQARVMPKQTEGIEAALAQPNRKPLFSHRKDFSVAHAHESIERHDHAITDSSVITVDGESRSGAARLELEASASKAGASLLPLCCLASEVNFSNPMSLISFGSAPPQAQFQSADVRAADRPPKA